MHVRAFAYGFSQTHQHLARPARAALFFVRPRLRAALFILLTKNMAPKVAHPARAALFLVRKQGGATRRRRLGLDQKSDKIGPKIFDATI